MVTITKGMITARIGEAGRKVAAVLPSMRTVMRMPMRTIGD